jgi:hypothetical protein
MDLEYDMSSTKCSTFETVVCLTKDTSGRLSALGVGEGLPHSTLDKYM